MKRIILLLLLVIVCSSSLVFADIDYLTLSFTGGFSSVSDSPSFGFNTSYQYMASLGSKTYFGLNSHIDGSLQFESDSTNLSAGTMIGPSLGFAFNPSNFLVFTIAPAIYTEINAYEYCGFGLGLDLNHSIFLGSSKSFGITFGTTTYLMFTELTSKKSGQDFCADILGYVGFTYRGGDFAEIAEVFYNIY